MLRPVLIALAGLFAACSAPDPAAPTAAPDTSGTSVPLIIAHRGASGTLPEHTLEAYQRAIDDGADFIEPDLVMTKDGVLIARHDRYLSTTTNVADHPEFADRKRRVTDLYGSREDWWAEDFTLAEIQTLRARQPFPGRPTAFDDQYQVPTFADVLALAVAAAETGEIVGVYPETKSPGHHEGIGLAMADPLLSALDTSGVKQAGVAIFVQSFEPAILRDLKARSDWPLVQLLSGDPRAIAAGYEPPLAEIASYADGVGPNKALLWSDVGVPSGFVREAHDLGLVIHPWTIRDDRVGAGYDTVDAELTALFDLGVDGVFTDFPATAIRVRDN